MVAKVPVLGDRLIKSAPGTVDVVALVAAEAEGPGEVVETSRVSLQDLVRMGMKIKTAPGTVVESSGEEAEGAAEDQGEEASEMGMMAMTVGLEVAREAEVAGEASGQVVVMVEDLAEEVIVDEMKKFSLKAQPWMVVEMVAIQVPQR